MNFPQSANPIVSFPTFPFQLFIELSIWNQGRFSQIFINCSPGIGATHTHSNSFIHNVHQREREEMYNFGCMTTWTGLSFAYAKWISTRPPNVQSIRLLCPRLFRHSSDTGSTTFFILFFFFRNRIGRDALHSICLAPIVNNDAEQLDVNTGRNAR